MNRWLLKRRVAGAPLELGDPSVIDRVPAEATKLHSPDDGLLVSLLRDTIWSAISGLPAEDFVLFQLMHREEVRQTELARMFGRDRRSVARDGERIAATLRERIAAELSTRAPALHLDWQDVVDLCSASAADVIASN